MRAQQLAAEFGIAGVLDFAETGDGLVKAAVSLDGATGELFLQGAQLTRWDPPGAQPVIYMSPNSAFAPGIAIRGGVPVIFPWFGPHGTAKEAPQHGFARTAPWRLVAAEHTAGALSLRLELTANDVSSPFWPEPYRATYTVEFGRILALSLAVQNRAGRSIVFEEALHTYFAVSDIAQVGVSGLAGRTYIDKTDGMRRKTQEGPLVRLAKETDSLYLDTAGRRAIEDPGWRRRIVIDSTAAASTIVWNPWSEKAAAMRDLGASAWRGMICIESGNAADNAVTLQAGGEHVMTTQISVDAG